MKPASTQLQQTPQRIVAAARALMTERGVLEVSLADISERAGSNVALVSYYFGSREGLMLAIVEADAEQATAHLARLLAADITPAAKITAHVRGLIETYYARPYLHRLLQKLLREGSPEVSARVAETLVQPVAAARRAIIAEGVAQGAFRPVDPGLIGFAIDGACGHVFSSGQSRRTVLGDGALSHALVRRYAREVSELVVNGLMTHPPHPAG